MKIQGVRRVCGSTRSCTASVMTKTTSKLCPTMNEELQVCRKYKTNHAGQITHWWFLICEDEQVLLNLEKLWDYVAASTSWKLEPFLKFLKHENAGAALSGEDTSIVFPPPKAVKP